MASTTKEVVNVLSHHVQKAVCDTRAKYREGRRPRAVKVYTINLESRYLLIQGVPAVGAMKELVERFALYGAIEQYNALDEYPAEDFTEVYLIKFVNLQGARAAKRKMDEQSFFGGLLHVCYAPEFETVEETRKKLRERKSYITRVTENKDYYVTRKKLVTELKDSRVSTPNLLADTSGSCAATSNISGNPEMCFPYSCDLPLCYFSSKCKCSTTEHMNRASESSQDGGKCDRSVAPCNHIDSVQRMQKKPCAMSVACLSSQKNAAPPSEAVGRFMPRTTQLQERKRRREDDRRLGANFETSTESNGVMIGPQLPTIPKVDLHDDSLNTTANLIRNKLKKVISTMSNPPEDKLKDVHLSHPPKQRRRI